MVRNLIGSVLVLALLTSTTFAQEQQEEKPWFDMENCEICQHMAKHQKMMAKIKWGIYKMDNGFCAVSVIPEDFKSTMEEVKAGMQGTISKAMSGEKVEMCGHCSGYGELIMAGAKMQEFETVGGEVTIFTASDEEVVAKLHEFADKTVAAHKKMMKELGLDHNHDDHEHSHDHDGDHKHEHDKKK